MNQREIDAVEKCIEIMKAGGSLEDCLQQIGDITPEMREMLGTAMDLMRLGENQVSSEQMKRSLSAILSRASSLGSLVEKENRKPKSTSFGMKLRELLQGKTS